MRLKRFILPGALALALAVSVGWGISERAQKARYMNYLNGMYEKSFYELIGTMGNMEVKLSKLIASADAATSDTILSDIWRQSYSVSASLSQLPASDGALENVMSFVNQLGEYCMSLNNGSAVTDSDRRKIEGLRDVLKRLTQDVTAYAHGAEKGLTIAEPLTAQGDMPLDGLEKTGIDYPVLIYDGPYSSAAQTEPKALGGHYYDYGEAQEFVTEFLGAERIARIHRAEDEEGDMPSWGFSVQTVDGNTLDIHVTRQGGRILWMLPESVPETAVLSAEDAIASAHAFLESRGYPNMSENYWQIYGGVIVINFVPEQDGILLYPDLIKVQISLETGEALGFESGNYLRNHIPRDLLGATVSRQEALASASHLENPTVRMCVIPLNQREVFCYEIKGTNNGEDYLIYVDAHSGETVNILKILPEDNGTLVI